MGSNGGKQTIVIGSITLDIPIGATGVAIRRDGAVGEEASVPVPPIFQACPELVRPIRSPESQPDAAAVVLPDGLAPIVSADTPIDVELKPADPSELSDALAVFPVVQDERFFYIGGPAVKTEDLAATHRSGNAFKLRVTKLPDVSEAPVDSSEERMAIGRALKLAFFKIIHRPRQDVGLRVPRLEGNDVFYEPLKAGQLAGEGRVALLVHGFLSETSWIVQALLPALHAAKYNHVVTWDYETFMTPIRDTAGGLEDALRSAGMVGETQRLDVIAHSMGGLVTRTLIAQELVGNQMQRVLLMGTPNGGTPIASAGDLVPEIASLFLNHYFPGLSLGPVTPDLIIRFLWEKIEKGMIDLKLDSDFIKWVNSNPEGQKTPLTLVVGDSAPGESSNLFQRIFYKSSDTFYGGANDLVVATKSMQKTCSPPFPNINARNFTANHFNYLVSGTPSRAFVEQWIK